VHLKINETDIANLENQQGNAVNYTTSFIPENKGIHSNNFETIFDTNQPFESKVDNMKDNEIDRILLEYTIKSESVNEQESLNFEMMTQFTEMNVWPQKTDICCWWCKHQFNTMPIAIPSDYIQSKFMVYGCFCSFNCSLAYMYDESDPKVWERVRLLKELSQEMGTVLNINKYAPSWKILTKFGGVVSIDQFRDGFVTNLNTSVLDYPIVSRKSQLEIHANIAPKKTKNTKTSNLFYLKNKKKKKTISKSSLERSMGIKIQ